MQNFLIVLPVLAYVLFTLAFYQNINSKSIWESLLKGHLVIFLFVAISTELLSLVNGISFATLLLAWSLFLLAGFVLVLRQRVHCSFSLSTLTIKTGMLLIGKEIVLSK